MNCSQPLSSALLARCTQILSALLAVVSLGAVGMADVLWSWSFGSEAGTLLTDGDLSGSTAPAATYNVLDIAVTQSAYPGNIGAMSSGELDEGSQPGTGFIWDGAADVQWFRLGGTYTNGANYYSNVTQHRYLFAPGFYRLYDSNDNTLVSDSVLTLIPAPPSGSPFCFGDGSGTVCPCGNNAAAGEGCANSSGAGALLTVSGNADLANDTFVLNASQCPPDKPGVFFQGTLQVNGGLGSPFGDGLLCAGGTIQRLETVFTDGGGLASSSVVISAQSPILPGDTRYYQYWYRDPAGPCNGQFNTSNAFEQSW